jgi:hypothetical protein
MVFPSLKLGPTALVLAAIIMLTYILTVPGRTGKNLPPGESICSRTGRPILRAAGASDDDICLDRG